MQTNQRSFVASADIEPSRFVKISGVQSVAKAGADENVYGVSQEGTREAPIPGVTPMHALTGEPVSVYGPGDNCEVECGAAVTAGARVKSDANGRAITATAGDEYYGEAVNTTTTASQKLKITIVRGTVPAS